MSETETKDKQQKLPPIPELATAIFCPFKSAPCVNLCPLVEGAGNTYCIDWVKNQQTLGREIQNGTRTEQETFDKDIAAIASQKHRT